MIFLTDKELFILKMAKSMWGNSKMAISTDRGLSTTKADRFIKENGKMMPKLRGEFVFSLLAFLSFFFVLMTYFGVNFYIAQGLHSYGQGVADGYWWINIIFAGMGAWIAVVFLSVIMAILNKVSKPVKINDNEYHPEFKE
jgi:hypothetical protein